MNLNCLFVFISTELNLKFNPFLVDNNPLPLNLESEYRVLGHK